MTYGNINDSKKTRLHPLSSRCIFGKDRTTEPSDGFLQLRETSVNTRWEVKHLRLYFVFLAAGLMDLVTESLNWWNTQNIEKQWVQVLRFNSFLKLGQMPQIHQKVCNSTDSWPLGLSSTSFNATFWLGKFKLFTKYHYPLFKGVGPLLTIPSMH